MKRETEHLWLRQLMHERERERERELFKRERERERVVYSRGKPSTCA